MKRGEGREEGVTGGVMNVQMTAYLQEVAKEFLNVGKPEKLYEFFLKGTMLDEIHRFYKVSSTKAILTDRPKEKLAD